MFSQVGPAGPTNAEKRSDLEAHPMNQPAFLLRNRALSSWGAKIVAT